QVNRREKREQCERKESDGDRKRREPRVKETARHRSIFNRDRAGRDRAEDGAQKNRRDDARGGKDETPAALHVVALNVVSAKCECSAAQDDSDQKKSDRDMKCSCNRRECGWECCEYNYDEEYQPNVIRFPNRTNRFRNHLPLLACARAKGKQIPN